MITAQPRPPRTILVIEDDSQFREMLTQLLERDGDRVVAAGNGVEALAVLERITPDLIITDILMPVMDGVEFVMSLVRRDKHIPVIAISGGWRSITRELNLQTAEAIGVKVTLGKPFTREQLRAAIRQALE